MQATASNDDKGFDAFKNNDPLNKPLNDSLASELINKPIIVEKSGVKQVPKHY